ncbi:MAG: ATP-binding protein [Phascolarctobacterium sp.]
MIIRQEYLNHLIKWKDEHVIKVVTGIRRCGKSTLLLQYQDYLKAHGVAEAQIISINLEDLNYEELYEYKALYNYVLSKLHPSKPNYILIDEIQKVPGFEKAIDSLYIKPNVDIYLTGSNAYMLSGDLATLLTGRYVEISMQPFSFKEYCSLNQKNREDAFAEYLKYGGMPFVATMDKSDDKVDTYLEGIYNTVIVRDIEDRQIRLEDTKAPRKITDIRLLKIVAKYLASVIGSPISVRGIANYLVSNGQKVSPNTVNNYLEALQEAFIFYSADRFDIVGKQVLQTNPKYYMVDLGIRNHILPRKNYDLGFSIENIVFFELLRRGYHVYVGKLHNTEVDFVAQKQGVITYIQVSASMLDPETFAREIKPLASIKDNYEKIILTMDKLTLGNYNGIKVINLLDWLLE